MYIELPIIIAIIITGPILQNESTVRSVGDHVRQ